jgi:hypothetical protein
MSKLLLQHILSGKPQPVQSTTGERRPAKNPFMQANGSNEAIMAEIGVNQPLRHPMFVGYRNNKPIYAGSRLFVLY